MCVRRCSDHADRISRTKVTRNLGKECAYISPGLSGSTSTSRLVLDEGYMSYLRDVDGNIYIDFSSGW
ncbi:hypothetical protein HS121_17725 [bacterium]|nr:hypothetical protein [bacterium]